MPTGDSLRFRPPRINHSGFFKIQIEDNFIEWLGRTGWKATAPNSSGRGEKNSVILKMKME
jgi:hypothetical protein